MKWIQPENLEQHVFVEGILEIVRDLTEYDNSFGPASFPSSIREDLTPHKFLNTSIVYRADLL